PRNLLHILRILQEAFTNVLKHAQATRITVETGLQANQRQVFIRVSDNGRGLTAAAFDGRGLSNMARRAASFGGELRVTSEGEGTTMQLLLPTA
ncbi:MAG TPA: ATP-binding protein, partial [Burkholderiaceae bacterium]|nr:ATP-binding protein [Burkholderiaceae bacterium]